MAPPRLSKQKAPIPTSENALASRIQPLSHAGPTPIAARNKTVIKQDEDDIDDVIYIPRPGELDDDDPDDIYGKLSTPGPHFHTQNQTMPPPPTPHSPRNPRKRSADFSPDSSHNMVTDRPQGGGITITVEDFQRMQERITRLESERVRLSLSPAPPSKRSRSVHSYHELGAQPAVRINTPSPLAHGNTPPLARHQPVPYTPQNVDGIFPELQPTVGLDIRLILWPHVSPELIKTIMSNALDVTNYTS